MDRNIVYPGSIPLDTDMLSLNRNVMIAIGTLARAILGGASVVNGLVCSPAASGLAVQIGPGIITALEPVDELPYGSLPADTADNIIKVGINIESTLVTLPSPPATPGQSVAYLIEVAFQETDTDPVVLPYYNAANPSQPFSGPNNSLKPLPTVRSQIVQIQAKAGPVASGTTPTVPPIDNGWVGLYAVVVNAGDLLVNPANITQLPTAPVIPFKLPQLRPGFGSGVALFTWSGTFDVPVGVTQVEVELWGGGGGSYPSSSTAGTAGGAGGGYARGRITGLTPGQVIPVSVGDGGQAGTIAGQSPAPGGTSSFGNLVAATGGTPDGATPGNGVNGDVNILGGPGSPAPSQYVGGQGGNGALGGGAMWSVGGNGVNGQFPGGGASGAGAGRFNGAQGANGMVVVRW